MTISRVWYNYRIYVVLALVIGVRDIDIVLGAWTENAEHNNTIKEVILNNYKHIIEEYAEYF